MTTESRLGTKIEDLLKQASTLRNTAKEKVQCLYTLHQAAELEAERAKASLDEAQENLDRIEGIVDACVGKKRVRWKPADERPNERPRFWTPAEIDRLRECAKSVDSSLSTAVPTLPAVNCGTTPLKVISGSVPG